MRGATREDPRRELDAAVRRCRAPLYPELMAELDAIKSDRIGGLMLCRDWSDRHRGRADKGDLASMSRTTKAIIRAAGLREELTFTAFRHGGFTEAADADLSDAEIRHRAGTSRRRCCRATPSER